MYGDSLFTARLVCLHTLVATSNCQVSSWVHTGTHATRETTRWASALPWLLAVAAAGALDSWCLKHMCHIPSVYYCRHRPFRTTHCTHLSINHQHARTESIQAMYKSVAHSPTTTQLLLLPLGQLQCSAHRPPATVCHDSCCLMTWHAL
jgi:hypothetical protein